MRNDPEIAYKQVLPLSSSITWHFISIVWKAIVLLTKHTQVPGKVNKSDTVLTLNSKAECLNYKGEWVYT